MRHVRPFLAAFGLLLLIQCAGTPPPPPTTPATPPGTGEPLPPGDPPPAEPSRAPETATASSGYAGPDPCRLAVKGTSPVAEACREGGIRRAKEVMKDLVSRAKANRAIFRCDDCHKDPQDFTRLAADAGDKFNRLLAAAK